MKKKLSVFSDELRPLTFTDTKAKFAIVQNIRWQKKEINKNKRSNILWMLYKKNSKGKISTLLLFDAYWYT